MSTTVGENWARSYTYRARSLARPRTIDELQEVVAGSSLIRGLGTRHSFTDLADGGRHPPIVHERSRESVCGHRDTASGC
jgi:hypothetical protein